MNACIYSTDRRQLMRLIIASFYRSIPGNPRWSLAPPEMAWEGKSVGDAAALQVLEHARGAVG
jgi:hypothetical protein